MLEVDSLYPDGIVRNATTFLLGIAEPWDLAGDLLGYHECFAYEICTVQSILVPSHSRKCVSLKFKSPLTYRSIHYDRASITSRYDGQSVCELFQGRTIQCGALLTPVGLPIRDSINTDPEVYKEYIACLVEMKRR
jgi:hypothetical protein